MRVKRELPEYFKFQLVDAISYCHQRGGQRPLYVQPAYSKGTLEGHRDNELTLTSYKAGAQWDRESGDY